MNVSPDCDCWGFNDYPLVPDIGMAASFDPVALDQACVDMVKEAPALPNSRINKEYVHDHFAEKINLPLPILMCTGRPGWNTQKKLGWERGEYEFDNNITGNQ